MTADGAFLVCFAVGLITAGVLGVSLGAWWAMRRERAWILAARPGGRACGGCVKPPAK